MDLVPAAAIVAVSGSVEHFGDVQFPVRVPWIAWLPRCRFLSSWHNLLGYGGSKGEDCELWLAKLAVRKNWLSGPWVCRDRIGSAAGHRTGWLIRFALTRFPGCFKEVAVDLAVI